MLWSVKTIRCCSSNGVYFFFFHSMIHFHDHLRKKKLEFRIANRSQLFPDYADYVICMGVYFFLVLLLFWFWLLLNTFEGLRESCYPKWIYANR